MLCISDVCVQGVVASQDAQTDLTSTFSLSAEIADDQAEQEEIRATQITANSAGENASVVVVLAADQCS